MATAEFFPLITKLLEKTKERKVEWKGTYESTIFICALEGEYSFEIEKSKTSSGTGIRRLTMKDGEQLEVFIEVAYFPGENTSVENDNLYEMLDAMYESARRVALDIDKKVSDVSNILDKI
jgi:hypothetical protein